MEKTMTVKAIKQLISESSNEFNAVRCTKSEKEDKKNNGKAYSDAKKRARDFDGGLSDKKDKKEYVKLDGNKTTLDYTPDNVSDEYKKRVHAQVKGYSSVQEMENDIEKQDDYSNNENIYQGIKKCGKKMHDNEEDFKTSGLQAKELPKEIYKKQEMYESKDGFDMRNYIDTFKTKSAILEGQRDFIEKPSVKTVYFKKTSFLNEGHMISRIPDEFKNEGAQFKMKDKHGTEYLIEWANDKANIITRNHKQKIDETLNAYDHLSKYNGDEYKTSNANSRLNEENCEIGRMLSIVRGIKNKN